MSDINVASLFGALGLKIDRGQWDEGSARIDGMMRALTRLAAKVTAGFGFFEAIKKGLVFNSTLEDTKNQIAGMLALSKHSDLSGELGTADKLLANLQRRAASLPGTTQEYAQMLGMLTQPIIDAGLGTQDLEDLTVNAVVAAKALGVEWQAAARDVDQALRGQFHSTDVFTGKLLGSAGFKGEAGRSRFNAMDQKERAAALKAALTQKQLTQLADAQGRTASGRWSTLVDTLQQTAGKVAAPLFAQLVTYLKQVNEWVDKNSDKVQRFASMVGGVLATALRLIVEVIQFLMEHQEVAGVVLAIGAGFVLWSSPLISALVIIGAIIYAAQHLQEIIEALSASWNVMSDAERVIELQRKGLTKEEALSKVQDERASGKTSERIQSALPKNAEQFSMQSIPMMLPPWLMPAQGAGGNVNVSAPVNAPITITGATDPHAVGRAVKEHLDEHTARAYEHVKGGRR